MAYRIFHKQRCLSDQGFKNENLVLTATANSAPLALESNRDSANQYWKIDSKGDGNYMLLNYENTSNVVDIPNGNITSGTQLYTWGTNGNINQQFKIVGYSAGLSSQSIPNGEYNFFPVSDSLVVSTARYNNVNYVQLVNNTKSVRNKWYFSFDQKKGAYLIVQTPEDIPNNIDTYYVLSMRGQNASVQALPNDNLDNSQYWKIDFAGTDASGNSKYYIRNLADPAYVFNIDRAIYQQGIGLLAYYGAGTQNEQFIIKPAN